MFKFDIEDIRYEFIRIKKLSKATVAPKIEYIDSNGVIQKEIIPTAVAHGARRATHSVSVFHDPYPACAVFVGEQLVALEVADRKQYDMFKDSDEWIANIEAQISYIMNNLDGDDYYWDGQYIYKLQEGETEVTRLGEDAKFGFIRYNAYNTYKMGSRSVDAPLEIRAGLSYYVEDQDRWVTTSPIVRVSGGYIQIMGDTDNYENSGDHSFVDEQENDAFARLDQNVYPNIRFVNYAAKVISNQFGYDKIEALGLPLMMIEHRTFNLGAIPSEVQYMSAAPFEFSKGAAWCIGLYDQVESLDQLLAVRATFKMLLGKGSGKRSVADNKDKESKVPTKTIIANLRNLFEVVETIQFDELIVE